MEGSEAATEALVASRESVFERYRHYKRILGITDADIEVHRSIDLMRNNLGEESFDAAYRDLVAYYAAALGREAYRRETSVGGLMEFAGNAVVSVVGGELGQTLPLNKNENAELNIFLPTADAFSLVKPLGMDDAITAAFAVIVAAKHKVSVAPATMPFDGDAATGWTLTIVQNSPVFAFVRKYMAKTVYMTITYKES